MNATGLRLAVVAVVIVVIPAASSAQSSSPLRRLEVAAGIGVLGGAALGSQNADLRTATASQPYRLFSSSTRMSTAPIFDLRVGAPVAGRYGIEGHVFYGHPEVRTSLSSDAEHAPDLTTIERLDEYVIDAGVLVGLDEWSIAGLHPFATAGGGYLRQLHEGLVVIDDGGVFFVGGGVKHTIHARPRGFVRGVGARADVRLNVLSGGIHIDDSARRHVSVTGSLFVVF
ncbi:MAG TPA: hypothetical protein VH436_21885 [Vicinamibacterales bacterium]|jgi:hypothetical protein